jgi:hypothetical protein
MPEIGPAPKNRHCRRWPGIIRLVKSFGRERVEAACARALAIGARSFTSVNSILKNNLDTKRPADAAGFTPDSCRTVAVP